MDCLHQILEPEFQHIVGKDNPVANMLSIARYEDEKNMVVEGDYVGTKVYTTSYVQNDHCCFASSLESLLEDMYEGQ